MIHNHLKVEFQKRLKLAATSGDAHEGWKIRVNDRFSLECRFAGANFFISSVIGDTKDLKNKLKG